IPQRLPLDERHGEPLLASRFAGVVDGEDVRVLEPGGNVDLALKALGAARQDQVHRKDLQRDGALVLEVPRQIHGRHAAASQLALSRVAVAKRLGQLSGNVSQVWLGLSKERTACIESA